MRPTRDVGRATRIVLADDHNLVREALRLLLETEPTFSVIGEAADGLAVGDIVRDAKPEILVVDLMMPGLNGTEVTRQVARACPRTRVVLLSMHMNEAHVLAALAAGAHGYVRKDAMGAELIRAIQDVAAGHFYLSPPFSDKAIEAYRQRAEAAGADPYESLTRREHEVLQLAAEGLTNVEIASRLHISARTAEGHRANIMRKLDLHRPADLTRYAIRRGLMSVDEDLTS